MAKEVSRSSLFFLVFRDLSNFTGATRCYPLNIYPLKKKIGPLSKYCCFIRHLFVKSISCNALQGPALLQQIDNR